MGTDRGNAAGGGGATEGREAGSVERALYLPRGNVLRAAAGKLWVFGDDLLFRRRGAKRPLAKVSRLRSIERVHGDWLDLKHYYLRTPDDFFDLVPTRDGGDLDPFIAGVARQAGLPIVEREVDSVLLGHLNRVWDKGAWGKLLVAAEIALFLALVAYAYWNA